MRFNAMVNMESIREDLQASNADRGGGGSSSKVDFELTTEEEHLIVIDENTMYGGRRWSIEERNECKRLRDFSSINQTEIEDDDITLYPFAHQVGGHTQLLTLDKGTLCKPLVPRELLFYLNVPKQLVKFIPSYKGVVRINDTGHQQPPVVNQPLRSRKKWPLTAKSCANNEAINPIKTSSSSNKNTLVRVKSHEEIDSSVSRGETVSTPFELRVQLRQFSDEKMLKKNLSQENLLRADYISRPNEKYLLLLENVASKYRLPCILDLKMGTRQHDDNASEEKRHRQIAKCQASTSASLGVRLCGMQVYKVDYGGYLWYDKYYGRKMNENGLKEALREYFRLGQLKRLDCHLIEQTILRLKQLYEAIEQSPSFRFYGTSLLIIHESCQMSEKGSKSCDQKQQPPPVDVRLIDFAHTICDFNQQNGVSTGAIPGGGRASSSPSILNSSLSLDRLNFCSSLATTQEREQEESVAMKEESHSFPCCEATDSLRQKINETKDDNPTDGFPSMDHILDDLSGSTANTKPPLVGTKSTPQQSSALLSEPNCSQQRKISRTSMGPDKGLLFGLENLMRLLEDLKSDSCC